MRIVHVTVAALFVGLAGQGCATPEGDTGMHDQRFVGDWHVSAALGWALLATSTVYRLHPDGDLEVVFHQEGSYFEGTAGTWVADDSGLICEFSDRWWSEGSTTLHVESECDDGTISVVALDFQNPPSQNTTLPQPVLVVPTGATALWDGPQGGFVRCTDAPDVCAPY